MTLSHEAGPHLSYGLSGPSLGWGGYSLFDPRNGYMPGQDVTVPVLGWPGNGSPQIYQVPSALTVANIAASSIPVAGTTFPLVSVTGAGITAGAAVVNIANGQRVTGLLAIDGPTGTIAFGLDNTVQIYDPRTLIARAVRIVSAGDDHLGTFTIRGYDIYGQPMSEVLTGGATATATGKKAFKYIASVMPAGTLSGAAITIGTTDIIGFPLRVDEFSQVSIAYGGPPALGITAATGFVAADATAVSGTTGDVRGTYVLQSSSDATKLVSMMVRVPPQNLAPVAAVYTGLFGLVNFTN